MYGVTSISESSDIQGFVNKSKAVLKYVFLTE